MDVLREPEPALRDLDAATPGPGERLSGVYGGAVEIVLDVGLEFSNARESEWWRDGRTASGLRDLLQRHGLWFELAHIGKAGERRPTPLTSIEDAAATWKPRVTIELRSDRDAATRLRLTPLPNYLRLRIVVAPGDVEAHAATLLDAMIAFAAELRASDLADGVRLARGCSIRPADEDYARPRPPRQLRGWDSGAIVAFVDREWYVDAIGEPGAAEELARILAAALPPGATREEHGAMVVFRFVRDLTDPVAVAAARSAYQLWIEKLVPGDVAAGWNEAGDAQILIAAPERHPPLTFYDPTDQHGYKAIFAAPDGEGLEELEQAASWIKAKRLPDGTPVSGVSVIVPTREAAIALRERAGALGFYRLLYADNNGQLWNPFPAGHWIAQRP